MATLPEALAAAEQALAAGDPARADFIYRQILEAVPDEPRALYGLGLLALEHGNLITAEDYFNRVIAVYPSELMTHLQLFHVLRLQKRPAAAADCCHRALELEPDSPQLHNNLGIALKDQGLLDEAVSQFEQAMARHPEYADAHYNLANTLVLVGRLHEAEAAYRRAMQLAPRDFEPPNNLGTLLRRQGRFDEALAAYDSAVACRPDAAEAHRNRSSLLLLLGDFAAGWPEYEWRWRMPGVTEPQFAEPRWQGEPLAGRSLLVWAEQGFGDAIQFVRYAQLVKQAGARVVLQCARAIQPLFGNVPGIDAFCDGKEAHEPCDFYIPLLSLPAALGTTLETIPASVPYVFAEPERVERWRRELVTDKPLKVGINWQGSRGFKEDANRSAPLAAFAPLAESGAALYSLQKGFGSEQLPPLARHWEIVDLSKTLDEGTGAFVDTAAAMMSLDLVITTDTAIAHLAGALGVRTWIALQKVPNWRWLLDREDSPWYPTLRLFRQTTAGDWSGVFNRMAAELTALTKPARRSEFSIDFD